jgi:hypothetical protein
LEFFARTLLVTLVKSLYSSLAFGIFREEKKPHFFAEVFVADSNVNLNWNCQQVVCCKRRQFFCQMGATI